MTNCKMNDFIHDSRVNHNKSIILNDLHDFIEKYLFGLDSILGAKKKYHLKIWE